MFKKKTFHEREDKDISSTHHAVVNTKPTLINYVAAIFA
jgi:hypothetical protein